jgi:hypothetical protein
VSGVPRDR